MDRDTIIDGLRMTMDLFTFDPTTGEEKDPDDLNDLDRATYDACKGALEILERLDTDSDTISRQAAIDGKICIQRSNGVEIYDDYAVPVEYLEQLPPAQPEPLQPWEVLAAQAVLSQPKLGKWIYHIDDLFPAESTMECNQCHAEQPLTCDDEFCPHCGAKMEATE